MNEERVRVAQTYLEKASQLINHFVCPVLFLNSVGDTFNCVRVLQIGFLIVCECATVC